MIDPYKVLGVSRDATPEEIKKAYRNKAKQYHPDLHPDDPVAAKKMNEVNEAYDLLQNPAAYERKAAQERARSSYRDPGAQNGYYQGFGNYYHQGQYQDSGSNYRQSYYRDGENGYGQSGPYGGFYRYGFGFDDFFRTEAQAPQARYGDPVELQQAIDALNRGNTNEAFRVLDEMQGGLRNDRYYYVYAWVYKMTNAYQSAQEMITRALRIRPDDMDYRLLYRDIMSHLQQAEPYASRNVRVVHGFGLGMIGKIFFGILAFRFILRIVAMLFGGYPFF